MRKTISTTAVVVGTCPAAVLGAVCACCEGLESWDDDINLDAVCGKD